MVAPEKTQSQPVSGNQQAQKRLDVRRRPRWLAVILIVAAATLAIRGYLSRSHHYRYYRHLDETIEERVNRIMSETPLIDGHNDLAIMLRFIYDNRIYESNFTEPFSQGGTPGHVDLARLREGKNGGAFWSVFVPCPENGTDWSDENYAESVQFTHAQVDLMARLKALYPSDFSGHVTSKDALSAFRGGKLISPLGIEGLHQIGNKAANLRAFYDLGVRYATLTHNCGNIYADAALWESPFRKAPSVHGGVSPAGQQLISEMNRLGMIVDLSHTSEETQIDALSGKDDWHGSIAPPIFSHSSAYALCPHPRNVKDHVLKLVRERKSIVMVNFSPDFVSCVDTNADNGLPDFYPPNSTLSHVVDHIMHIGSVAGFDHVGIGSDFDGIFHTPQGLEDVSRYPSLVAELLRRGLSDDDVAKIIGGNILRVWGAVESVSEQLQREGKLPLEDSLPHLSLD